MQYLPLGIKKQMTQFTSAKLQKMFSPTLIHTENSKTSGQKVLFQMRWLILSCLIRIYTIRFSVSGALSVKCSSSHELHNFFCELGRETGVVPIPLPMLLTEPTSFHIYLAIRWGFPFPQMTTNN